MNQLSIFENNASASVAVAPKTLLNLYTLVGPEDEISGFGTLGELIYALNKPSRRGKANTMTVWHGCGKSYAVVQRYSSLGIEMSDEDGTAQNILEKMFWEVMPFVNSDGDVKKKPWQMTASQWGAVDAIGKVAYGVVPCLSQVMVKQTCLNHEGNRVGIIDFVHSEFRRRMGYGHNGPSYNGNDINSRHDVHVAYALARGDDVPEIVLDYYRDKGVRQDYCDVSWMYELIDKPYLRGRLSAEKFKLLRSLLSIKESKVKLITEENAPYLCGLMKQLPTDPPFIMADDLFFKNGLLSVREMTPTAFDIGTPHNAFSSLLRANIIAKRMSDDAKQNEREFQSGNRSIREKLFNEKGLS